MGAVGLCTGRHRTGAPGGMHARCMWGQVVGGGGTGDTGVGDRLVGVSGKGKDVNGGQGPMGGVGGTYRFRAQEKGRSSSRHRRQIDQVLWAGTGTERGGHRWAQGSLGAGSTEWRGAGGNEGQAIGRGRGAEVMGVGGFGHTGTATRVDRRAWVARVRGTGKLKGASHRHRRASDRVLGRVLGQASSLTKREAGVSISSVLASALSSVPAVHSVVLLVFLVFPVFPVFPVFLVFLLVLIFR